MSEALARGRRRSSRIRGHRRARSWPPPTRSRRSNLKTSIAWRPPHFSSARTWRASTPAPAPTTGFWSAARRFALREARSGWSSPPWVGRDGRRRPPGGWRGSAGCSRKPRWSASNRASSSARPDSSRCSKADCGGTHHLRRSGPHRARFKDPDLTALARHGEGRTLLVLENAADGFAMLDEVMIAVTCGEVTPMIAGVVSAASSACVTSDSTCAGRRSGRRRSPAGAPRSPTWCPSARSCLIHRSELMQLHGAWPEAVVEAQRACERLATPPDHPEAGAACLSAGRNVSGCAANSRRRRRRTGGPVRPGESHSPVWPCFGWPRARSMPPTRRFGTSSGRSRTAGGGRRASRRGGGLPGEPEMSSRRPGR